MRIKSILLLLISITLVIISAMNLSVFRRLHYASPRYKTDEFFDTACHVSKKYVQSGFNVSIIMLIFSILLMITSSFIIFLI